MTAILAALLIDPAILRLNAALLASDICERFDVTPCVAYAAIREAYRQAIDGDVMPEALAA